MNSEIQELNARAEAYGAKIRRIQQEISRVIVGQDDVVGKMLLALISNGHVLIEGVPGLAKTLMIKTLSECLDSGFVRIQFTPDLLPADITGTKIYEHRTSGFKTVKGPIFTNFVLADEINRAPPKVQSALLESMQERQVSIQGDTLRLPEPFMVLATQNPIESEGTYKLPEAQVDRFMFKILIDYPEKEGEVEIIDRFTEGASISVSKQVSAKELTEIQEFNRRVYADPKIKEYVAELVDASRHPEKYGLEINGSIEYGASPRASLWLILAAKAHAMVNGRGYVKPEDVKAVAYEVLRHRIILTYEAEAEEKTSDGIISLILDTIKVP